MNDSNTNTAPGTDWTRLLTDPDLVGHLGQLLQTYREAPADKREEALLAAMREIKSQPAPTVHCSCARARSSSDSGYGGSHAAV